jgi:cathepsin A (carboxypeptidase C)
MMALFEENGPYKIQQNLSLSSNPYSWTNNATVIYVDQPVGTGLSTPEAFNDLVVDEEQVAENMFTFLQTFMQTFPQYAKLPFYIFGYVASPRLILFLHLMRRCTLSDGDWCWIPQ